MQEEFVQKANEELNLYIPADVEGDNETYSYELLFFYLRKLYYYLASITKEEVTEIFTNFYHSSPAEKSGTLNQLNNRITKEKKMREILSDEYEKIELNKITSLIELLPDLDKAKFLYFVETGEEATENTDLSKYLEIVNKDKESQLQQDTYGDSLSAEEVAQRYLGNDRN